MNRLTEYRKDLKRYEYKLDEKGYCYIGEGQIVNKLGKLEDLEEQLGCPLEVIEKALDGFYISGYGYVSNDDDFIYLRKDTNGYYLKVVIHPSKPIPPNFVGYCDIHFLKDYKKTWWLRSDKSE